MKISQIWIIMPTNIVNFIIINWNIYPFKSYIVQGIIYILFILTSYCYSSFFILSCRLRIWFLNKYLYFKLFRDSFDLRSTLPYYKPDQVWIDKGLLFKLPAIWDLFILKLKLFVHFHNLPLRIQEYICLKTCLL